MQTSEKIDLVAAAVVKAQAELKHAAKDSTNEGFKQGKKAARYADLSAVWDAAKPVLVANDLAALQDVVNTDAGMGVRTRLLHKSGQWIEFDPPIIPLDRKNAHGAGSALTYGRRYSLSAALGVVADEDDDGNAASVSSGSGVADAQSTTNVAPVKNAPGISDARAWIRDHFKDLNACENGKQLMEAIEAAALRWIKICGVYPALWVGPDGSGLRGEALKLATIFQCRPEFDAFVKKIEAQAAEIQTPKQAAQ